MATRRSTLVLTLNDRVTKPSRGVRRSIDSLDNRIKRSGRNMAAVQHRVGKTSDAMLASAARFAGPAALAYGTKQVVTQAANFEQALTGIQKKAGTTAAETAKIGEEIRALATSGELASSIDEIAAAYERGAAAGIPIEELKQFSSLSAKAADAFEMSSEDVGNAAAGFATNLDVPIGRMEKYFDLINGLADSGISDEKDIISFLDRAGVQLQSFGQSKEQAAALGATLLNLKMPAEVAVRAMNTLSTKLLTPKATEKSTKAFAELYGNADAFQEMMKEDANEALLDFLEKIDELDKFKRAELLTDILGQGFSDEVARLSGGLDEFRRNLRYARDEAQWFGSLDASYQLKLDDFWSQWQIMKNASSELAIDVGTTGMPAFKAALATTRDLVDQVGDGLDRFEADLDTQGLNDAKDAVGDLVSNVQNLMGMGGEESQIERFFGRIAGTANQVSNVINGTRDALQAMGLAKPDDDSPEKVEDRRNSLVDAYGDWNPVLGPLVKDLYDANNNRGKYSPQERELNERRQVHRYLREKNENQPRIPYDLHHPGREAELERWKRHMAMPPPDAPPAHPSAQTGTRADHPTAPSYRSPRDERRSMPDVPRLSGSTREGVPAPSSRAGPMPTERPDMEAAKAEIAEIDRRLGELYEAKRQVEGAFDISASPQSAETMRKIGDEMQELLDRRDALENPIHTRASMDVGPLVSAADRGRRAIEGLKAVGGAAGASVNVEATGREVDGKRAAGGPVKAGGLYEVNERGQELWSPGRPGQVFDAKTSAGLREGGSDVPRSAKQERTARPVNVTVNNRIEIRNAQNLNIDELVSEINDRFRDQMSRDLETIHADRW